MIKYQDKQIKLILKQFSQTKSIQIDCSIHTNIHSLKILICKYLKLNPLQTSVEIFHKSTYPLKATSTLLQNGINQNSNLMINVKSQGLKKNISKQKVLGPIQVLESGLSIQYYCKNLNCINYQKDSILNLGFGQFDVKNMIDSIRCQVCPYKSQKIHVAVGCRQIIVKHCLFSIMAIEADEGCIFKQIDGNWIKCKQEKLITRRLILDDNQIGKILKVRMI